jgi:hypothetical protein
MIKKIIKRIIIKMKSEISIETGRPLFHCLEE